MLLPHILSRVPLCQLLQLQRVSRAFRALVQLHLAGLRRFDAAEVSQGPEPLPRPGSAPAPPPAQTQCPCVPSGPLGPPRMPRKELPPSGKYSQSANTGYQLRGGVGSLLGERVASPRVLAAARKELIRGG